MYVKIGDVLVIVRHKNTHQAAVDPSLPDPCFIHANATRRAEITRAIHDSVVQIANS